MAIDLYPEAALGITNGLSIWPLTTDGREIDLRQEFYDFLYGSIKEIPKGRVGALRRMRLDDDGNRIACPCVDAVTKEPDKDTPCPYCWGEGYFWDEEWIVYYKMIVSSQEGLARKNQPYRPGVANIPLVFFYLEHHIEPTRYDKLIELGLDVDGSLVVPYRRVAIYNIATAEAFRSDNGRVEYWRCGIDENSVKAAWQV